MNKILAVLSLAGLLVFIFNSCQQGCVNNILLETTRMDIRVNSDNLGIILTEEQNSVDTIRNPFKPFYNYPEFRRFGYKFKPSTPGFITSAFAADDCPEQKEYISRMDPEKTRFSINVTYDASSFGLGLLPADTNLLDIEELVDPYLSGIIDNAFLNAGAPTPLTILKDFFEPINAEWITFHFYFEELDGTGFEDSVTAYVDMAF